MQQVRRMRLRVERLLQLIRRAVFKQRLVCRVGQAQRRHCNSHISRSTLLARVQVNGSCIALKRRFRCPVEGAGLCILGHILEMKGPSLHTVCGRVDMHPVLVAWREPHVSKRKMQDGGISPQRAIGHHLGIFHRPIYTGVEQLKRGQQPVRVVDIPLIRLLKRRIGVGSGHLLALLEHAPNRRLSAAVQVEQRNPIAAFVRPLNTILPRCAVPQMASDHRLLLPLLDGKVETQVRRLGPCRAAVGLMHL